MKFYQVREIGLDEIEEAADRCLHHRPHSSTNTCLKSAKSRFVQNALGWLKSLECLRLPEKITLPFEEQLNQYTAYMDYEQGLAETTIEGRVRILQNFLKEVANTCESLGEITPLTIDKIIIKKHDIDKYSRLSIRNYATVVRSFVKYHGNIGQCQLRLADTIKAPRVYKFESLPLSPSWDDIKVLLQSTEGDHPTSIRDRAILMLLSIYGLRCCEVAKLRLENIDWRHEFLHLKRAKRSRPQTFPLSLSVGNALLRYIKEIRPTRCSLKEVFLCRRAPYRPLSNYSIYQIVNRRLKPLQLEIKHHGPHALRHACASHLINEGVSLKEISDQLGHQGLETTRIYTKVDLSSLRQIADFDIGDVL